MTRSESAKRAIRKTTSLIVFCTLCLVLLRCVGNFEEYNTDPTGISDDQVDPITVFKPLQRKIFDKYQTAQNLSTDAYSGYMMSPTPFMADYNLNYFLVDSWNRDGFDAMYISIMSPILKLAKLGTRKKSPDLWAIALIIKVEAMHRVTDKFGPIPYSKVGTSTTYTPYDTEESVYGQFFQELDTAVINLKTFVAQHPGEAPFREFDLIFGGDDHKWIKFANSFRLRLALHIVKAAPQLARIQGEKALNDDMGLMADPDDDAAINSTNGTSDLFMITHDWDDNRVNACVLSYLIGFHDPRLTVYASPATDPLFPGQYVGIRIGSAISSKDAYKTYASLNTEKTFLVFTPQPVMCAAESWFLKAEASLRQWQGAGDAQTNYETGVQVSMKQWGVEIGNYLQDDVSSQAAYVDPKNASNNSPAVSTVTIKWDDNLSKEEKLDKIMTQKWLATFPEGQEAWTGFRRTGYPKLFPVVINKSGGKIDTNVQIRRLSYPQSEYSTNKRGIEGALQHLGGPDDGGTRLWWDIEGGNF